MCLYSINNMTCTNVGAHSQTVLPGNSAPDIFSPVETMMDNQVFSVYLGNIPADVLLEDVHINEKQLMMSESTERGYSITPVVYVNGSRAYELRLPFEDEIVHWMVRAPQRTCITS